MISRFRSCRRSPGCPSVHQPGGAGEFPTPRLEDKLGDAVDAVILRRRERLNALERSFAVHKGRLLQPEGANWMNETYYIPANFTDAGRVIGLFELRNLVEAVILVLPVLYFCLVLLPLELTAKITVTLIIVVPLGGFGLIGVRDDSLTRWLGSWWRWRKGRRLITFRGECKKK